MKFIQINLDLTEWTGEHSSILQHDCLHVQSSFRIENDPYQILSYCLSEWPSKWNISIPNKSNQKLIFVDLYKLNITSEQLFLWSTPIDIIENYAYYLSHLNDTSLSKEVYYNCTLPRFGRYCQYSFAYLHSSHQSLERMTLDYYKDVDSSLTCYTQFRCISAIPTFCLDWSDICNNIIQCEDGRDEIDCWQLDVNQCEDNEFRCVNGQCIPLIFYSDHALYPDCLDRSDESYPILGEFLELSWVPIFSHEDITCWHEDWSDTLKYTTSCIGGDRFEERQKLMLSERTESMSEICWMALKCYLRLVDPYNFECYSNEKQKIIAESCPDMFYMPPVPVIYGHMYLAYTKKYLVEQEVWTNEPEYICYNERLCGGFHPNRTIVYFNNTVCHLAKDFPPYENSWIEQLIRNTVYTYAYVELYKCNTIQHNSTICNHPMMYRCWNSSKCISKYRLLDGIIDCDFADDEQLTEGKDPCSKGENQTHFYCKETRKCISRRLIGDLICDCSFDLYQMCEEEIQILYTIRTHISFQTTCDGFTDLKPLKIDDRNHTDETDCIQWPCINIYTRCDGLWNCPDGADEVDCHPTSLIDCPVRSHVCISPVTLNLTCLPITKGNNGEIDCVGAIDEPRLCRKEVYSLSEHGFYCTFHGNEVCFSRHSICNGHFQCDGDQDERICNDGSSINLSRLTDICAKELMTYSEMDQFLCNQFKMTRAPKFIYFTLSEKTERSSQSNVNTEVSTEHTKSCHRGLPLQIWIDENKNDLTCLCPPSYYGSQCQYQTDRISLTMQFQSFSDSWQIPFLIVVSLIDEEIIHSYEQFVYIPMKTCQTKFNVYLLYADRPKNQSKKYSIHVDVYEKISLTYRASLFVPIRFLFLPIQRIAVLFNIPSKNYQIKYCQTNECHHGQCLHYFNDEKHRKFCRCDRGWTGHDCSIPHECQCSSDSLYQGRLPNNRSICLCPVNKWGHRCLLRDETCRESSKCQNDGQCISINPIERTFHCLCPQGYFGDRCEIRSNELILSFSNRIPLPETIFVHFIQVKGKNYPPATGVTFKRLPFDRKPTRIFWLRPFHLIFVEIFVNKYYLSYVDHIYNQSIVIHKEIQSSDRCPHIREVFNETFFQLHLIERIKFYHLSCQNFRLNLSCFYDDVHLCICTEFQHQQQANCFEFNHTVKRDCSGKSLCENGGQCLQDNLLCPQTSVCMCPKCFYGSKCQFTSKGFSLSLDAILAYHIQPNLSLKSQPIIVWISLIIVSLLLAFGFIDGSFCLLTFKNKDLLENGCGIYLLCLALTTLFTTVVFSFKFYILLISQMGLVTNRLFLYGQCLIVDYLLQIGLQMNQWLHACIAFERVITVVKGIHFDKKKSKKISKFAVIFLLIFLVNVNLIDPIHRQLIDDDSYGDERTVCVVKYHSKTRLFHRTMSAIHFTVPFLINFHAGILIIFQTAQHRTITKSDTAFQQLLRQQLQKHKHLLISSLLLFILNLPRLIITFAAGCMETPASSWLFLMAYFVSFVPTMLIFTIYVLPARAYKQKFRHTMATLRRTVQRRLHVGDQI
ncbi:unnamed protein product [Adineta ricciae]|uniref:Uncharacterized protein n=1 Tax=Adineta ricciae TaxID=249248 RepID=A0A814WAF9_ADIRI|nr:unnamed protein product [Adineta ricciae]CAF1199630.1 unnamed protein product [Adineta ricciae]